MFLTTGSLVLHWNLNSFRDWLHVMHANQQHNAKVMHKHLEQFLTLDCPH